MNEELPTARIGCCPVSSFCILPSSFAYRGHRPAQFHRAAGGNRQRCKPPNGFQQSQIIRRIHLHHRRVNQACAREQTHFGRTLDDVIIGNQITIVRDETPCRCGHLPILGTAPLKFANQKTHFYSFHLGTSNLSHIFLTRFPFVPPTTNGSILFSCETLRQLTWRGLLPVLHQSLPLV